MTTQERLEKDPNYIATRLLFAEQEIQAVRKQAVSAYDADLRKLSELRKQLTANEGCGAGEELFPISNVLTPELKSILIDPAGRY